MADVKKTFFKKSTAGQINSYDNIKTVSKNFVINIVNMKDSQGLILKGDIIPSNYRGPRHFMKHGPEVKLHEFKSIDDAVETNKLPATQRIMAFNSIKNPFNNSYSFEPFYGDDRRKRKVSLVECVEGAKIYTHAHQPDSNLFTASIDVKPYSDAAGVKKDGAEVTAKIPSRRKNHVRHNIKLLSVPIVQSKEKWGLAYAISSVHNCESKFWNIRYVHENSKENSKVFNFCAHDVAAYLSTIDYFVNKENNKIPLHMNPFAIPSKFTVNYYNKLLHNVLVQTSKDKRPRSPTIAEKEILLWGLVHKFNAGKTFMAQEHTKVKNYNWKVVNS